MPARLDLTQALARAEAYKRLGRPVPKGTRFRWVKQIEARVTMPLLFRQMKYNAAVVDALQQIRAGLDGRVMGSEARERYVQHHEGIAALRRDMVAVQQQAAALEARLARLEENARQGSGDPSARHP